MSEIQVNKISPSSGTTITLGDSGDTFTIPSGATITNSGTATGFGGDNTPAFKAYRSGTFSIPDSSATKIPFNDDSSAGFYDTDSKYDATTNYRFTPTVAGKYFVYGYAYLDSQASSNFDQGRLYIFKNGSAVNQSANNMGGNFPEAMTINVNNILDLNGTTDYVELYAWVNDTSGTPIIRGQRFAEFGAYKIIGA